MWAWNRKPHLPEPRYYHMKQHYPPPLDTPSIRQMVSWGTVTFTEPRFYHIPWDTPFSDSFLSSGEHSWLTSPANALIPYPPGCSIGLKAYSGLSSPLLALLIRLAPTLHWVSVQETCPESPNLGSLSCLWLPITLRINPRTQNIVSLCYDPLFALQCPLLECKLLELPPAPRQDRITFIK